jgi:hypothetical protein
MHQNPLPFVGIVSVVPVFKVHYLVNVVLYSKQLFTVR